MTNVESDHLKDLLLASRSSESGDAVKPLLNAPSPVHAELPHAKRAPGHTVSIITASSLEESFGFSQEQAAI